jgi:hypothetical protein
VLVFGSIDLHTFRGEREREKGWEGGRRREGEREGEGKRGE